MINNVQNNQPAFMSKIRMSTRTARALSAEPIEIQKALKKEIEALSKNGRNNEILTFSLQEQGVKNYNPHYFQIYSRKLLCLELLEKRGTKYYSSKARKTIRSMDENYDSPYNITDLYRIARGKMKPTDKVSNGFLQFV